MTSSWCCDMNLLLAFLNPNGPKCASQSPLSAACKTTHGEPSLFRVATRTAWLGPADLCDLLYCFLLLQYLPFSSILENSKLSSMLEVFTCWSFGNKELSPTFHLLSVFFSPFESKIRCHHFLMTLIQVASFTASWALSHCLSDFLYSSHNPKKCLLMGLLFLSLPRDRELLCCVSHFIPRVWRRPWEAGGLLHIWMTEWQPSL